MKTLRLLLTVLCAVAIVGIGILTVSAASAEINAIDQENPADTDRIGSNMHNANMRHWMMQNQIQNDEYCSQDQFQYRYQYDWNYSYKENCSGDCMENLYQYEYEHCHEWTNEYAADEDY